jgi:hypothetical protein
MSFTVGIAQDLPLLDSSFDVVTCTLAMHHVPARRPLPLHPGGRRMRHAAATVGPLEELAATAGYLVESSGHLPLLRYVVAIRPEHQTRS